MQTMMHSSMVYSAPSLVGYATLLLGLVRHGGWRWRAGGPMRFIVEEVFSIPYRTVRRLRAEEGGRGRRSRGRECFFPAKSSVN
jgi:hypothetical protein